MNLKEFMQYKNMNALELSKYLEIHRNTVYKVLSGANMNLDTAFTLKKKTKGKIKLEDLYNYINQSRINKKKARKVKQ